MDENPLKQTLDIDEFVEEFKQIVDDRDFKELIEKSEVNSEAEHENEMSLDRVDKDYFMAEKSDSISERKAENEKQKEENEQNDDK